MPTWLTPIVNHLKQSWQRYLIAGVCIGLVVARMINPQLTVDWITLILLGTAASVLWAPHTSDLLAYLIKVLPYIKKAKLAGVEVELTDKIKELFVDVDKAQADLPTQQPLSLPTQFKAEEAEILQQIKNDPRAALLLLAARIEQQVMLRLTKHGLSKPGEFIPMSRAFELCVQNGVFPHSILRPFREFWNLRNRVAHGDAFEVDDAHVLSLVSIGLEVLKLVSLEERDGSSN
jgi:hypothetical protein